MQSLHLPYAVSVPYEAAFFYEKSILQSRLEDCVDVLFVMDVFYTFRTAYVNEQGVVVRDGAKIVKHYMQTWFPIDCAASLPLEYIILMFGINGSASLKYLAMFKVRHLCPSAVHQRRYGHFDRIHTVDATPAPSGPIAAFLGEDQECKCLQDIPIDVHDVLNCALDSLHMVSLHDEQYLYITVI